VVRPWELSGGLSVDFSAAAKPVAEEKSLSARADLTAELHPEREDWLNRYAAVRRASVDLAAPLSAEDQVVQSMPDTSPTKWHLAHTTWFFETFLLKPHASGYVRFDERFGFLFNSYYEAVGARHPRPQRGLITRPSLDQVHAYRAHVDAAMTDLIAGADETVWPRVAPLLELGLNHEQQHQELILMDIKHLLAQNPIAPAYLDQRRPHASAASALTWTSVPGGLHAIGHAGDGFAFDNEGPRHKVWLEPFKIADRLTSNGEYLEFIEDGGYQRAEFWLSDGWGTVCAEHWEAPLYWRGENGARTEFTLGGERPIDPHEPVCHVSYYEADAFAQWAGKRLPREQEWEIASRQADGGGHFAGTRAFHPRGATGSGLAQMQGDVWEWTASAYSAYPGFRPAAGAIGEYNGKFMCNQFVLRGGACVTPEGHIRTSYRNFFPPQARWAFSGVRLADDDA
jgi:ergothioneine biosynthesis protein EgtB